MAVFVLNRKQGGLDLIEMGDVVGFVPDCLASTLGLKPGVVVDPYRFRAALVGYVNSCECGHGPLESALIFQGVLEGTRHFAPPFQRHYSSAF